MKNSDLLFQETSSANLTITSDIFGRPEDSTIISRSKLHLLKEIAENNDLVEPYFTLDRAVGTIASGLFFTGLSWAIEWSSFSDVKQVLCVVFLIGGLILAIYSFYKDYDGTNKRRKFKKKVSDHIDEIIEDMDHLKEIQDKQNKAIEIPDSN